MKKLISTNGLGRKEWLLKRKQGITGTDAAAILNLSPYRSAFSVYQDKLTDVIDESDNESMRQGRDLEEYVAQRFMQETGLKVRRANAIYYNEEYPFLMADFDRLIVGQKAGLECKTVSPYSSEKWADGKIPIHYQIQCQHYLGVSGFDAWYIASRLALALCAHSSKIIYATSVAKSWWCWSPARTAPPSGCSKAMTATPRSPATCPKPR